MSRFLSYFLITSTIGLMLPIFILFFFISLFIPIETKIARKMVPYALEKTNY
jgi:hypothetical protein